MEINEIIHEGPINIDLASELLESHADIQKIESVNWASFKYKPEVKFRIAITTIMSEGKVMSNFMSSYQFKIIWRIGRLDNRTGTR